MSFVLTERIEIDPAVMIGKPVIRVQGTRIPVELIIRKLGQGATEVDLLDAYRRLTAEDIRAALALHLSQPNPFRSPDPLTGPLVSTRAKPRAGHPSGMA